MIHIKRIGCYEYLITGSNGKSRVVSSYMQMPWFMHSLLDLTLTYEQVGVVLDVLASANPHQRALDLGYPWLVVEAPYAPGAVPV